MEQLTELLIQSLKPVLSKLLTNHDFSASIPKELKDLSSKFNNISREFIDLNKYIYGLEIEIPRDLKEIPEKLDTFQSTVLSLTKQVAELKNQKLKVPAGLLALPGHCLESGSIRRIQWVGYGVLEFLGVETTFDIFQNIHILYLQYGVLTSSGYDVLFLCGLCLNCTGSTSRRSIHHKLGKEYISTLKQGGRLRCKGVTKQIIGVVPKGLALQVVLVDLHSKDESGKGFKLKVN
ncbi:hypothetical protein Tco_1391687 [Tanacetum coccineum]